MDPALGTPVYSEQTEEEKVSQASAHDPEKAVYDTQAADTHSPELLISFSDEDASNPKNWPSSRKWVVTSVLSFTGFNRIMVSTMMAPALTVLMQEFNMGSAEANMSLSVYLLATAFGPMVNHLNSWC